jgi:hypothetical protein
MKGPHTQARVIFLVALAQVSGFWAMAQENRKDKTAVTFEELYDEPYSVNKLFIGFQPLYGEAFATNATAGFGVEASYYYKSKMDFKANFRKTYSSSFFDLNRDLALKNNGPGIVTKPEIFNYYELGGTYHIKDFESQGKTTIVLYKSNYKGNLWASRVPFHAEVPCKVRKIYGARLGAIIWNSTADLNRALKQRGLTNADLKNPENIGLPDTYLDAKGQTQNFNVFGNIYSTSLYTGASITWMRNVAVSFDKYDQGVDDGILTAFFDIQYAPSLKLDPIKYTDPTTHTTESYSTSSIKLAPFGVRAGIDGKFNRQLSWGYGGEVGYRPSIKGRTFYALFKITFPLYSTNLEYKVESFGK